MKSLYQVVMFVVYIGLALITTNYEEEQRLELSTKESLYTEYMWRFKRYIC